ncbi:hypothetical protein [Streptomyces sp. RG80]|uniref:hypothetical protein n=1 Tax=Streptomyces sp. RG80 TaxID=3157340 RepID=UPI00338FDCA7
MSHRYVGPEEIRAAVRPESEGRVIASTNDLAAWVSERGTAEAAEPFTYVVGLDGRLRLAPRRSEHVACAGGRPVLAAGEMAFSGPSEHWRAHEISNLSTGYCPDLSSWHAVARALEAAGVGHPGRFTHAVVFRRCERCRECSVVREDDFVCVFCGSDLPLDWNVDS